MNCPICADSMVLAQATNFGPQYHYCRRCKRELAEMTPVAVAPTAKFKSCGWDKHRGLLENTSFSISVHCSDCGAKESQLYDEYIRNALTPQFYTQGFSTAPIKLYPLPSCSCNGNKICSPCMARLAQTTTQPNPVKTS